MPESASPLGQLPLPLGTSALSYRRSKGRLVRTIQDRQGQARESSVPKLQASQLEDARSAFDKSWLLSKERPRANGSGGNVRVVDLFAGCGGLTLGVEEAARGLGLVLESVLANDIEEAGLRTYGQNFPEAQLDETPIEVLLDGDIGTRPTVNERRFVERVGAVDIVIGGPPCQGHSDLNNHTRRSDPKNELYLRMGRFCEVVRPTHVVIENVPGVLHDSKRVAQRTWRLLEELGYRISTGILNAADFGAPQHRKRSFTLASLKITPSVPMIASEFGCEPRTLRWAIEDLERAAHGDSVFDSPPQPRPESVARIEYLFANDLFDLPDSERPDCHRLKAHSYKSMYGRMRFDRPSQTITTGFGVMGRGRYVHPTQRRTITPHEAARIQGFPDFFSFAGASRTELHMLIGNAVPSQLGFAVGGHLLR